MAADRRTLPFAKAGGVVAALGGAAVGVSWWLSQPHQATPPIVAAIVYDRSDSMAADTDCEAVAGLAARVVSLPGLGRGSKLSVYGTGDPSTALEPIESGTHGIPVSHKVMEGKEAGVAAKQAMLDTVVAGCKKSLTVTKSSPIFLAVKRAMEQLQAMGCGTRSVCHLFVRTDGEETEEAWLRESIRRGKMRRRGEPTALNNGQIRVTICGFSETRGEVRDNKRRHRLTSRRGGVNAEFLRAVWAKVFTDPEQVVFEPFCHGTGR